jgi:hypothetical protein
LTAPAPVDREQGALSGTTPREMPQLDAGAPIVAAGHRPVLAARARPWWLAILAAAFGLTVCLVTAQPLQVRLVNFPSSTGSNVLRMARLSLGSWFQAVGYYQPSSVSYWAGTTFFLTTAGGDELTCQARVEGWVRPQARTGTPIRLNCLCEQARLHNRRPVSCYQAVLGGARP